MCECTPNKRTIVCESCPQEAKDRWNGSKAVAGARDPYVVALESAMILLARAVLDLADVHRSTPQVNHPSRHKAMGVAQDVLRLMDGSR